MWRRDGVDVWMGILNGIIIYTCKYKQFTVLRVFVVIPVKMFNKNAKEKIKHFFYSPTSSSNFGCFMGVFSKPATPGDDRFMLLPPGINLCCCRSQARILLLLPQASKLTLSGSRGIKPLMGPPQPFRGGECW